MIPGPVSMDSGMAAALAAGWIEEESPPELHDILWADLEGWRAEPKGGAGALWLTLLSRAAALRLRDPEISACRAALSVMPEQGYFRYRLAQALWSAGAGDEACRELAPIAGRAASDPEILALRLDLEPERLGELARLAEEWIAGQELWSPHIRRLADSLLAKGETRRLARLCPGLAERFGGELEGAVETAKLCLALGDAPRARALFTAIAAQGIAGADLVLGGVDAPIRPYSAAIEADILARVEAARQQPEPPIPAMEGAPIPDGAKIVLVGFRRGSFPNDVCHHLLDSAARAGLAPVFWADDALMLPHEARASDAEVQARVDAFAAAMADLRPDLIVLDWCAPLSGRGLRPDIMAALKTRLGFHLVVAMRDAHAGAMECMTRWLEAADSLMLYHPGSPILEGPHRDKAYLGWVPARPDDSGRDLPRDLTVSFAGSVAFTLRNALLSVLLTEDLPFHAVIGPRRAEELPDMAAYLALLRRSKAVFNVSAHTLDEHLVTGRVWESVAMGAALIEQDNPATAGYFTPWRHYLPWRTAEEAVHLCRFVERNPEQAALVAEAAGSWARRRYAPERLWRGLWTHAMGPR